MFKVSFKERQAKTKEVFQFQESGTTVVIIRGTVSIPDFLYDIPSKIENWMKYYTGVKVLYRFPSIDIVITSTGKAKLSDGDTFDPKLGERIAEARAMIKIYHFMIRLCTQMRDAVSSWAYGDHEAQVSYDSNKDSIQADIVKYVMLQQKENLYLNSLIHHEPNTQSPSQS